ncbi:MAG: YqzL family protein [Bacilli bacterium]|nr:YqzL family protein [Mycoplasmatota bacterium]MDY4236420.1 YqzL family protein [Bacilli bacterium]
MNKALWNLFKETGDLRYYVFLKEMEKVEENYYENRKSNRNSTK